MGDTACGPDFLPAWLRKILFGWFFNASCIKHDNDYRKGGSESDRIRYDLKFFASMLKDTVRTKNLTFFPKLVVAVIFFIVVFAFGRFTFNYKSGNKK